MEAEAAGIERRAAALSRNQEAVIAQQIASNLPEIVRAAASSFDNVGTFTVLNGAGGITEVLAELIQQGGALANVARQTMTPMINAANGTNGSNGSNGSGTRSGDHANGSAGAPAVTATGSAGGGRAAKRMPARSAAAAADAPKPAGDATSTKRSGG